jgi:predicted  nucleic acid-binding Zn-ribbon protein
MPKATAAKTATKRKAAPRQTRQPLKDRTNEQSDVEDVDVEDDEGAKPKAKRAKTMAARKPRGKAADALAVIPETQPDPVDDIEQSIEMEPEPLDAHPMPAPKHAQPFARRSRSTSVQPVQPLAPRPSARSMSAQPGYPPPRERSGSVSGTERERRGGDPELRRKLNEMTKKYENLHLKYQNLQEVGRSNADTNFEKLKRTADEKTKDADKLIASLKKEIAELRKSNRPEKSETEGLQKQITALTTANTTITAERDSLKEKLQTTQNEVKSLEAKLIAARQQVSSMQESAKVPASATKNATKSIAANATEAQKEAKMKENLYSDLTGLIIRGVKRKDGEDEFDCIQTGRNGSEYPQGPVSLSSVPLTLCAKLCTSTSQSRTTPRSPTPRPPPACRTRRRNSPSNLSWTRTGTGICLRSYPIT